MKNKLLAIINHYGIDNQQRKLEEEVFELQEAITIYENSYHNLKSGIEEELADVKNVLEEIRYYYDIEWQKVNKIQVEKIERQLERIKNETDNTMVE